MGERVTAELQLQRLLYILPAAQREVESLSALATRLDVDARQIVRDLEEVTAREFYHPAGAGEDIQVAIEPDRVRIWTKGEFHRPVRLTPLEALALGLGLRALATEHEGESHERILATAVRLERELASAPVDALLPHFGISSATGSIEGLRALFADAIRALRPCRIRYLKEGEREPAERVIDPYALAFAANAWYLIAHCSRQRGVRVFRLDRMLEAWMLEGTFEIPNGFDPRAYISHNRVYRAEKELQVRVRYSRRVARWVREHEEVEECDDGSVIVRHRVADPHWLVRHVLRFGADAVVLEPEEAREMVREAVAGILGGREPAG